MAVHSMARRSARPAAARDISHNPKNVVQSLAKGFRVLQTFTASDSELTLAEVARRAELDNATAFRILNTLVMLGYVERTAHGRSFRLSLKVLDLGFNAIARMELRDRVRPVLRSLVGEVNEAASVAVLDGAEVVYIERVQAGMVRLGVDVRVGSRIPAYCSAVGLAILAYLPRSSRCGFSGIHHGSSSRRARSSTRRKFSPASPD